jgi:hypothetical protein
MGYNPNVDYWGAGLSDADPNEIFDFFPEIPKMAPLVFRQTGAVLDRVDGFHGRGVAARRRLGVHWNAGFSPCE